MTYFGVHNHTDYSNIRLLDCINKPKNLIDTAIDLGLGGIAITDHECLSSHMTVNQYAKDLQKTNPNFTIALGNEIYLTEERENRQQYFHFILVAKDWKGYKILRELSSTAWLNSYHWVMERVPLLKKELKEIMEKHNGKGHIVATTACLGGELPQNIMKMMESKNEQERYQYYNNIINFIDFCHDIFGEDDFYLEIAPNDKEPQLSVNKKMTEIAKALNLKMIFATDAHFLRPEDRPIHKAYLSSQDGEREVDDFYEHAHLMTYEEVTELLLLSCQIEDIEQMRLNTLEIMNKIEFYDIAKPQHIPRVEVKNYPKRTQDNFQNIPAIDSLFISEDIQERYWINKCWQALQDKDLFNQKYVDRLNTEADILSFISENMEQSLYPYFNTFQHYIDLFWESGSIVGPGRGSATGFLSNYLLDITQVDPIEWGLAEWRFLNKDRAELPDIDIDLCPSKRPVILEEMRKQRGGQLRLSQVATFGTEGTRSAILTACRGMGIDNDIGQYMSSLVPEHRGFLWSLQDVVNGNPEEGRKPVYSFIREVNKYDGLLDVMIYVEGLIKQRSSHASGIVLFDEDPYETAAFMKTPSGDIITQFDLHSAEIAGDIKYDFLVTEISDKIVECIKMLQEYNEIDNTLSLREAYNTYLHPSVIDTTDERIWTALADGSVLDVFQFNSQVGLAVAKQLKPTNPVEMTAANAIMRLMAQPGEEPMKDRFERMKENPSLIKEEMKNKYKLSEDIQEILLGYLSNYYGTVPIQELMMEILMDPHLANFTLKEANDARKIVGKKQMDRIGELKDRIYSHVSETNVADYIWDIAVYPSMGYAFSVREEIRAYTLNLLSQGLIRYKY